MATRFDLDNVWESRDWVSVYPNAQGFQEKFLQMCEQEIKDTEFPNIDIDREVFKTGGFIFNKEKTEMLGITFTKSQFKNLGIYFRAQPFGNVVIFTLFNTVERGLWDKVRGKSRDEIYSSIRDQFKGNIAKHEEFTALNELGRYVFWRVMEKLDPEFNKSKGLSSLDKIRTK